ncbi:MAG: phage major capsid protein [Alteromonas sp.]|jgi:HK97 family phage major capsid protein|nr:phage major capsid protein [Alteromonas sp.]
MAKLHELKQKRTTIAKQMRALHEDIGDKSWSEDQESRWGGMQTELDGLDSQISREERLLNLDQDELDTDEGREERNLGGGDNQESRTSAAFENLIRNGFGSLSDEERSLMREMRANGTTPDDKGGFTVPKQFRNRLVDVMKQFGGVANIATIIETDSGAPISWPVSDGTAEEGEMVGENSQTGEEDITFSEVSLGAKKLSSKIIRVSNELLTDSGVDISAYIARRIGTRIGRGEAKQLIMGSGSGNNINGLLGQANKGKTAAGTGAITWEEFLGLKHSVDPAYRMGNTRWLWNDTTLLAVKTMKDGQGRPLWLPDVAGVTPATFDGDQYQIDQAMPNIGAGLSPVAYGDFSAFQIRRVRYMVLKRLVEKYADYDQTGFLAFHRFDAVLEDLAAVKRLEMAAA